MFAGSRATGSDNESVSSSVRSLGAVSKSSSSSKGSRGSSGSSSNRRPERGHEIQPSNIEEDHGGACDDADNLEELALDGQLDQFDRETPSMADRSTGIDPKSKYH